MTTKSPNWKLVSRLMSEMHNRLGGATINLKGWNTSMLEGQQENLTPDELTHQAEGSRLSPKQVRGWLWDKRQFIVPVAQNLGDDFFLWSVHEASLGVTYLGWGRILKDEQAKMVEENSHGQSEAGTLSVS